MIISEEGVRKIIRESLKFRSPEGVTIDSDDPRYRCDLSALKNAPDETWAAGVLVFLSRLLFFSPTGMTDKSILRQLDLFLATGQRNLTPEENEKYNIAIKKILNERGFKDALIKRIENTLDVMFFPTASAVCNIINSYYESSTPSPGVESISDIDSIVQPLRSSSRDMLKQMRLRDAGEPTHQILFPRTFLAKSKGNIPREDYEQIYREERARLANTIFNKDSQDVSELMRAIQRLQRGTGTKRAQEARLYSLSNYFDKIINDEKEDNYKTAKKIKKEIRKFLEDNPISI